MRTLKITNQITNRDSSTVEKYFNDVAKEELLTPQQEVELAQRIKQGDQQALEKLVRANLRFVISVAKQYHHGSMPLNDLINEGNLGLIKAAKMFDETKGFKFISYAVWWIRQSIMEALNNHSRIVRIPSNKIGELSKISQAVSAMEQKFEREPTAEELADYLGVDIESIQNTSTAAIRQSSLDAPIGEEENSTMYDVLKNPESMPTDGALSDKDSLQTELRRLMSTLSDREHEVIKRFFGIGFEYSMSMEDIADDLGLSQERVRQIKEGALRKLRSNGGTRLLKSYLS
jgi:RNA polymerase primary sigma factor